MNKPRLFIGVACHKPTAEFVSSLGEFLPQVREKYNVTYQEVWGEELVVAQNRIARSFVSSHTDWLLMLEDDHSGHTVEMVDDLVNSGHRFCMMRYHSRWYPYIVCGLNYNNVNMFKPTDDYAPVELIGFGMTVIHRSVFDLLELPYFRTNDKYKGDYATDQNFCKRCLEVGVQPYICSKHCLTHRGINDDNCVEKMLEFPYRDWMISQKRKKLINA